MPIAMVAFIGRILRRGELPISHLQRQHVFPDTINPQPAAADVCLDMIQLSQELKDKSPPSSLDSTPPSSNKHIWEKPNLFKRHYRWIILLFNAVMVFAGFVLLLLIMDIATPHLFMVGASGLLLLVFIFGDTMKTVFQAIVLLFAVHPFDVGDKCEVDGVQMIVEEMNILTTVFTTDDGRRILYPNSVLMGKAIGKSFERKGRVFDVRTVEG